eukprot:TRINITY_DN78748_c0_g1_i1.p1 TRINITY_DN78748_c0_g1~~TRINITY_DN78748_c0_g1_i1.p1  ORF type:complete len:413 (-),score=54.49 TRINITY_DN78748_c0_g1_i1:153-1226(-)
MAGFGYSASFHSNTYLEIPESKSLNTKDFSYSFWIFLKSDAHGYTAKAGKPAQEFKCPIISRGRGSNLFKQQRFDGGVLVDRVSGHLRIELSTLSPASAHQTSDKGFFTMMDRSHDVNTFSSIEAFESHSRLRPGRWFHVAVVRNDAQRRTRLYINGVLDQNYATQGFTSASQGSLFVGGSPSLAKSGNCKTSSLYLDELKIYSRPLSADEVQAEAASALAGVEPSFVRIGCVDCLLETAMENCPGGYHICTTREMHMGGYQVARTLGLIDKDTHVWSHETSVPASTASTVNVNSVSSVNATVAPHAFLQQGAESQIIVEKAAGTLSNDKNQSVPTPQPKPTVEKTIRGLGLCCADF